MNTSFKYLSYLEEDNIGFLTINREDKLNALSAGVISELKIFFEEAKDSSICGLIFTGAGEKAFIAGADIAAMTSMSPAEAGEFAGLGQEVTLMMESARFPIIAAVNGFALGGGLEFALACDFILATENAVFGLPEVSLGLIPGFGGTQRLAKIIGQHRAKELIYSARKVKAKEAKEIGLVLELFSSKEDLIVGSKKILDRVKRNSPNAVNKAKVAINNGVDCSNIEGLKIEQNYFANIFESHDMKEGTKAFLDKRKANFKGH